MSGNPWSINGTSLWLRFWIQWNSKFVVPVWVLGQRSQCSSGFPGWKATSEYTPQATQGEHSGTWARAASCFALTPGTRGWHPLLFTTHALIECSESRQVGTMLFWHPHPGPVNSFWVSSWLESDAHRLAIMLRALLLSCPSHMGPAHSLTIRYNCPSMRVTREQIWEVEMLLNDVIWFACFTYFYIHSVKCIDPMPTTLWQLSKTLALMLHELKRRLTQSLLRLSPHLFGSCICYYT